MALAANPKRQSMTCQMQGCKESVVFISKSFQRSGDLAFDNFWRTLQFSNDLVGDGQGLLLGVGRQGYGPHPGVSASAIAFADRRQVMHGFFLIPRV